mgnify:CR=1 FL=1
MNKKAQKLAFEINDRITKLAGIDLAFAMGILDQAKLALELVFVEQLKYSWQEHKGIEENKMPEEGKDETHIQDRSD